jgi:hypothetical protein
MRGKVIDITVVIQEAAMALRGAGTRGPRGATRRRHIAVGRKRLSSCRVATLTMTVRRSKNNTVCPKTASA